MAAERTRKRVFGAGGIAAAQGGGCWPALAANNSATPAATARSVSSRPSGEGAADQMNPERAASASHCLAVSASNRKSAFTRSLRSMLRFPQIVKGISRLELTTGNEEGLDLAPNYRSFAGKLMQKNPRICDIHVVTPGAELHRQQLLRRQSSDEQSWPVEQHLTGLNAVEVALRTVVQPVLGKVQRVGYPKNCPAECGRVGRADSEGIHILGGLPRIPRGCVHLL